MRQLDAERAKGSAVTQTTTAAPQPTDLDDVVSEMIAKKEDALEELDDRVMSIDNANDFITVGGLPPLLRTLQNSRHPRLQWRAAQALATITQNNPRTQAETLNAGAFEAVTVALEATIRKAAPTVDEIVLVAKCFFALSCMIRAEATDGQDRLSIAQWNRTHRSNTVTLRIGLSRLHKKPQDFSPHILTQTKEQEQSIDEKLMNRLIALADSHLDQHQTSVDAALHCLATILTHCRSPFVIALTSSHHTKLQDVARSRLVQLNLLNEEERVVYEDVIDDCNRINANV